jgi:hypothetical protein
MNKRGPGNLGRIVWLEFIVKIGANDCPECRIFFSPIHFMLSADCAWAEIAQVQTKDDKRAKVMRLILIWKS